MTAGIENFVFRDLLHIYNANMPEARVDQSVIMKMPGYKTGFMLKRYNTVE